MRTPCKCKIADQVRALRKCSVREDYILVEFGNRGRVIKRFRLRTVAPGSDSFERKVHVSHP